MLGFMLSAKRDAKVAKRFLKKVFNAPHTVEPRVITSDQNAAYLPAIEALKADEVLPQTTEIRQSKYLNNTVEQDHCFIKRRTKPGLGFGLFNTVRRTLKGYEAMNMIRKGQIKDADRGDAMG
jgi:transposase, IS6 family